MLPYTSSLRVLKKTYRKTQTFNQCRTSHTTIKQNRYA
jgi:hypothetical protein